MGYLGFISNLLNIFMQGASFAIGQGEPYLAIMNIQAANAVLPPSGKDEEGNLVKGYALDLTDVLPKITPRDDNEKMYLSESRKADVNQWVAINKAYEQNIPNPLVL